MFIMQFEKELRQILAEILDRDVYSFEADTALLGAIPEFDSMAVTRLIVEMEMRLNVSIDDIDLSAETFLTFSNLLSQIQSCHHVAA